jgi:alpha-beta hydrolase superfamily lysophospholipase
METCPSPWASERKKPTHPLSQYDYVSVMTEVLTRRDPQDPRLCWALHKPAGDVRAAVLLTHGYGDHQARYDHVVKAWTAKGLLVATWDLRGHGDSEGPRGHIVSFDDYLRDLFELVDRLDREPVFKAAGKPVAFGHSMGGLVTFHAVLQQQDRFRGMALCSPQFALAMSVPIYKRVPAKALSRLVPRLAMPSGLTGSMCTRDPDRARDYDNDPKVFPTATARWFTEALAAMQSAGERASRITLPLVALLAGDDKVVSTQAARTLLQSTSSKTKDIRVLDGYYHEIINDPGRDEWIAYFADRMLEF